MKENTKAAEQAWGGGRQRHTECLENTKISAHLPTFTVCRELTGPSKKYCFSGFEIIRDSDKIAEIVRNRPEKAPRVTPRGNRLITNEVRKPGE